ncbi:PRA1 family protein B4-like [Salvia miltiorrhiza]|uniref:PRA1 family protein B4-like n=1 Tax=Salvia miltiorrhiza TaxID=226208 RepID=UPI0025AD88CC|nr:PRA1 family protein B4-like [Salvia miltiorrhiza]
MASNPAAGDQQSSSTSAVRALLSRISQTINSGLSDRRPWSELADRSGFSKPESFSDANLRLRKNYAYFRTNYLMIVTAVLAISLLTNPLSLLLLSALLAAWLFLYLFRQASDPPITVFGRQFSDRAILFALIVSTVVVLFLTSVGYVLVSALMVGLAIVFAHGAFRVPEDLFLDEAEPLARVPSLLSFLAGGAPAPQPPIAARA